MLLKLGLSFFFLLIILSFLDVLFIQKPSYSGHNQIVSKKPTAIPSPIIRKTANVYGLTNGGTFKVLSVSFETDFPNHIVRPVFGGNKFYYVDGFRVMQVTPETDTVSQVYVNANPNAVITGLTYDEPNMLYVVMLDTKLTINGYSIGVISLTDKSVRIIGPFQNYEPNGSYTYLFSTLNGDIVYNYGGDGCDGGGEVYTFSANVSTLVLKTGAGCNEDPYFVGGIGRLNSILLASQIPQTYPDVRYDTLYLQDVTTGTKTPIFDLKTIPDKILAIHLDAEKQHAVIITDKGFVFVDLQLGSATSTIASVFDAGGYLVTVGNKIYLNDTANSMTDVIDGVSGQQNTLLWQSFFGGVTPFYLGTWNSELLMSVIY